MNQFKAFRLWSSLIVAVAFSASGCMGAMEEDGDEEVGFESQAVSGYTTSFYTSGGPGVAQTLCGSNISSYRYYRIFQGPVTTQRTVTTQLSSPGVDTVMMVRLANGMEVCNDNSTGLSSTVSFTAKATYQYPVMLGIKTGSASGTVVYQEL